jgi:hypothetical protein
MTRRYVSYDFEGEPWLDNPQLIIANPRGSRLSVNKPKRVSLPNLSSLFGSRFTPHKKGKKRMAKKHRKMTALQRKYFGPRRKTNPKRHHSRMFAGRLPRKFARKFRRRSTYHGLLVARGSKARVSFRTNKRHRYRHNPAESSAGIALPFGLRLPAVKDIAFGALGLFVPGMITSRVMNYVPASMQGSTVVTWLVKIASVLVPGYLIKRFYDARAGYAFMIGGAASLFIDAIRTFVPSLSTMIGLGFQPLLGYYPGGVAVGMGDYSVNQRKQMARAQNVQTTPILLGVPDRLNPAGRY